MRLRNKQVPGQIVILCSITFICIHWVYYIARLLNETHIPFYVFGSETHAIDLGLIRFGILLIKGLIFSVTWDCDPIFYLISASQTRAIWTPPDSDDYYKCISRSKKDIRMSKIRNTKLITSVILYIPNKVCLRFLCYRERKCHEWLYPN